MRHELFTSSSTAQMGNRKVWAIASVELSANLWVLFLEKVDRYALIPEPK